MSAPDGMHADAPASVQPEPQAGVTCARDRALVILAELVLETRDVMRAAHEKRDVYMMEPHLEKLDRFEGVCREILNPSGRRASGVDRLGREHFVNAGKKGGATLLALRGPEYFAEIGRRGVAARAAKRATARGDDA